MGFLEDRAYHLKLLVSSSEIHITMEVEIMGS
jgi:hypothetical protein